MKKNLLLILVLSLLFFIANAQEQDFISHKIKSGESLYALTKKYKISLEEIKKANPDLGAKIDIGTVVRIPSKAGAKKKTKTAQTKAETTVDETASETPATEDNFIKHKLKSKESFAVLSRKYGVSIAEIKKANPQLISSVRVGTLINIPKKPENKQDIAVEEQAKKETPMDVPQEATSKQTKESATTAKESTTNKAATEDVFVFHKVKSKETLSTISKKYKKTLTQLKKANPDLAKGGLQIGQLVKIPTGKKVAKQSAVTENTAEEEEPSLPNSIGEITHTVKSRQTLFSIAKEYKVSVNDIKKWNNLTTANSLKLGQSLVIKTREDIAPKPKPAPAEEVQTQTEIAKETVEKTSDKPSTEEAKPKPSSNTEPDEPIKQEPARTAVALKEPSPQPEIDPDKVKVTTSTAVNASGYSKITETGLAELMGETVESTKFLALHKTAPIGTLIQVKNPMNGIAIFVRIIGKLPDNNANDKIIIKVTKKVRERIGALNNRFPVEISYIP